MIRKFLKELETINIQKISCLVIMLYDLFSIFENTSEPNFDIFFAP